MTYLDLPSDPALQLLGEQLPGQLRLRHVRQFRGGLGCTNDLLEVAGRDQTGRSLDSYSAWQLVALCRPLPDIARWLPSWQERPAGPT